MQRRLFTARKVADPLDVRILSRFYFFVGRLRIELLRRVGPRLELTKAGEALAPALAAGFTRIFDALNNIRRDN